jgi:hypothetical protein
VYDPEDPQASLYDVDDGMLLYGVIVIEIFILVQRRLSSLWAIGIINLPKLNLPTKQSLHRKSSFTGHFSCLNVHLKEHPTPCLSITKVAMSMVLQVTYQLSASRKANAIGAYSLS